MLTEVIFQAADGGKDPPKSLAVIPPARSRLWEIEIAQALEFEKFKVALLRSRGSYESFDMADDAIAYPSCDVVLSTGSGEEDAELYRVVFDGTLFSQLVCLYAVFGWPAMDALLASVGSDADPIAGTPSRSSSPDSFENELMGTYLRALVQMVANIVFDALVYMEQCLRSRSIEALTRASGLINEGFKRLKLEKVGSGRFPRYIIRDPEFGERLRYAMTAFAKSHNQMLAASAQGAKLAPKVAEDKERHANLKAEIAFTALASDAPMPEFDIGKFREEMLEAERRLSELEQLEQEGSKQADGLRDMTQAQFGPATMPVLLLIAPSDDQTKVGNKLGQFYSSLSKKVDALQQAIPVESNYVQRLVGRAVGRTPDRVANVPFRVPPGGLELKLAATVSGAGGAVADAIILSDLNMLQELLESDQLPTDSMEYLVLAQYSFALERLRLQKEQAGQDAAAGDRALNMTSAAASLLHLATWNPLLGAASRVLDAFAFARFVISSIEVIQSLDVEMDRALLTNMHGTYRGISQVGELMVFKERATEEFTVELGKLLLMKSASQIRLLRLALAVRGYYADVEILLGTAAQVQPPQ